ncbi:hypothetical protein R1flu_018861 [Riccia fluitans]|uniref:RNA polymerase II second largest subunit n=1 Tax=Riccia fluitans TaxID=41844 RepID=A0ABD1ZH77_9MARC
MIDSGIQPENLKINFSISVLCRVVYDCILEAHKQVASMKVMIRKDTNEEALVEDDSIADGDWEDGSVQQIMEHVLGERMEVPGIHEI